MRDFEGAGLPRHHWELGRGRATKNLLITPKLQLLANYKMCTSKQIAHHGKLSNAL